MARSKKGDSNTTNSSKSTPTHHKRSTSNSPEESRLIVLLHQRNPQALVYLSEYAGCLEISLRRKFGECIPIEDLRDLITDTLIQAFRRGPEYNPDLSSVATWLSMLGHYNALKYLRDNEIIAVQRLDDIAERIADRIEQEATFGEEKPSVRMEAALQKLSPQRAAAIRMHYYGKLSIEQIANEMGITPVSVRCLLSRGRDDLSKLLDPYCDDV